MRPYVEGGVSLNRLSNAYSVQTTPYPSPPHLPFTIFPLRSSFTRHGPLFGMGVDIKLHGIHVTPGLRYTHYNEKNFWLPSTNALDFLVGFTF